MYRFYVNQFTREKDAENTAISGFEFKLEDKETALKQAKANYFSFLSYCNSVDTLEYYGAELKDEKLITIYRETWAEEPVPIPEPEIMEFEDLMPEE